MGNYCSPCDESAANDVTSIARVAGEEREWEVLTCEIVSQDTLIQPAREKVDEFPHLLGQRSEELGVSLQQEKRRLQIESETVSELEAFVQKRRLEIEQETQRLEGVLLLEASVVKQRTISEHDAKEFFAAKAKLDAVRENSVPRQDNTLLENEQNYQANGTGAASFAQHIAPKNHCADLADEEKGKRLSISTWRTLLATASFDEKVKHTTLASGKSSSRSVSPDSTRDGNQSTTRSNSSAISEICKSSLRSIDSQPPLFTRRAIEIVFSDKDGDERMIYMTKRPLGAKFTATRYGKVKVSHVSRKSYADELGIAEGWVVEKVAGQDVFGKSFEEVQAALKDRTVHLPLGH